MNIESEEGSTEISDLQNEDVAEMLIDFSFWL
jgi:hypothetical protein